MTILHLNAASSPERVMHLIASIHTHGTSIFSSEIKSWWSNWQKCKFLCGSLLWNILHLNAALSPERVMHSITPFYAHETSIFSSEMRSWWSNWHMYASFHVDPCSGTYSIWMHHLQWDFQQRSPLFSIAAIYCWTFWEAQKYLCLSH